MSFDPNVLLENILKSPPFIKSDIHKRMLIYLGTCYKQNKQPTEADIAIEIFNRDRNFNPTDDTIVRSTIYKLRKKLEAYYLREGKQDHIELTIPKGHYNLEFVKRSSKTKEKFRRSKIIAIISTTLVIILSIFIIWQLSILKSEKHQIHFNSFMVDQSEIWNNYFNNSLPYDIIIGDFYIFEEYHKKLGRRRRIMDYSINTERQFYQYKEKNNNLEYNLLPIGELPHHSIFNIKDISYLFFTSNNDYQIKMSSNFNLDETLKNNIIYLGDFKSLRILDSFLQNHNIGYEYKAGFSGKIFIMNSEKDTIKIFDNSIYDLTKNSKNIDYSLLLKLKGPNQENYLFIIGYGYISQLETVHILCNQNRIKHLENEIKKMNGSIPESFIMVLEISGLYLTPYFSEISYFKPLTN